MITVILEEMVMKYSIIVFICFLFLIGCKKSPRVPLEKIDYQIGFEPGVRSIKEYKCEQYWSDKVPPQIVKSSCKLSNLKEYTQEGYLAKELTWYDLDNPSNPGSIKFIKHNESGQIIEEFNKWTGAINTESKIIHSYNAAGFQIERIIFDNGKITFREETIYDEYNCPTKKSYYKDDNQLNQYEINEFDKENRLISSSIYDESKKLLYKHEYEYNEGDEWIVYHRYDTEGKLILEEDRRETIKSNKGAFMYTSQLPEKGYTDVEHYSNGKVKSWHFKNQDGNDVYQVYDEDSQRITERKIYSGDKWQDTFTWKYRDDGVILEESESTSRIIGISYYKKTTYYKFDSKNNWIEKTVLDTEGRAIELTAREIEYYNLTN